MKKKCQYKVFRLTLDGEMFAVLVHKREIRAFNRICKAGDEAALKERIRDISDEERDYILNGGR